MEPLEPDEEVGGGEIVGGVQSGGQFVGGLPPHGAGEAVAPSMVMTATMAAANCMLIVDEVLKLEFGKEVEVMFQGLLAQGGSGVCLKEDAVDKEDGDGRRMWQEKTLLYSLLKGHDGVFPYSKL